MIAALIAVATVVIAATIGFFLYATIFTTSVPVRITIRPGDSTNDVAELLSDKRVVRSALLFKLYVKKRQAESKLQSGDYQMRTGMSNEEALELILKGPYIKYYRVVIPEGLTVQETAAAVDKQSPISKASFLQAANKDLYDMPFIKELPAESLEGYLFPKTYTVTDHTRARDLVALMLRQFEKETAGLDSAYAESKGIDPYNVITIASMIEREVKVPKERELVSEVIYNRLRNNMPLQIDATVQYALPSRKESLTYSDLEVDSPYNTYLHTGLPPGPIASPGLASIEAALHPQEGNYLYYVLTGADGSHTFTTTADEFERVKREHGR